MIAKDHANIQGYKAFGDGFILRCFVVDVLGVRLPPHASVKPATKRLNVGGFVFHRIKSKLTMLFIFDEAGQPVEVPLKNPDSVLDTALRNRLPVPTSCGGMGTCGACRVKVISAPAGIEERNEIELEMALERGFEPTERLACQLEARPGLQVRVCGSTDEE